MELQRTFALSKNVRQIKYDTDSKILTVLFTTGHTYQYRDVPEEVYRAAENAESIGSFIHQQIKGKYSFNKV